MKLLTVDCAANLCAACIWDMRAGCEIGRSVADIGKGHAEHLMATIADALSVAATDYGGLGRLAVSVGPGSFTGVRVGVAATRGLALALGIPAVGISTLEAVASQTMAAFPGRAVMAAIEAGHEDVYAAVCDPWGKTLREACMVSFSDAVALAVEAQAVLCGTAAPRIAQSAGLPAFDMGAAAATADIAVFARLAAGRDPSPQKPSPLYLRAPDAKPQAGFILPRTRS